MTEPVLLRRCPTCEGQMLRDPVDRTKWRCRACTTVLVDDPFDPSEVLAEARATLAASTQPKEDR